MNTEILSIVNPFDTSHIEKIDAFEKENEISTKTSAFLSKIKSFTNKEEYKVENEIQYKGAEKSDLNDLKIANQGGLIILRYVNEDLGNYKTDEEEIIHDGTLLSKIGLTNEDIQFKASFDISIELNSGKKYKANVNIEMPIGNLIGEGTTNKQINGSEIVFKRY